MIVALRLVKLTYFLGISFKEKQGKSHALKAVFHSVKSFTILIFLEPKISSLKDIQLTLDKSNSG